MRRYKIRGKKSKVLKEDSTKRDSFWSKYWLIFLIFAIILLGRYILSDNEQHFDSTVIGNIVYVENKYSASQGRGGGSVSYYYLVNYQYMVTGKHYSKQCHLDYTKTNIDFVKQVRNNGGLSPVKIVFDSNNPENSMIVVE